MANLKKINEILEARRITKEELAEAVNTTSATLIRAISTNLIKCNLLEDIARYLEVPVGYFFDEVNQEGVQRRTSHAIPMTAPPPLTLEDKLIDLIDRRVRKIEEQAEQIGALRKEIEIIKKNCVSVAPAAGSANAV